MKLNLGCGKIHKDGYVNIDNDPVCCPDALIDLGKDRLPYENDSVDEIVGNHFLEHLTREESYHLFYEVFRVCKPDAVISICVPHYLSPVANQIAHKQSVSEQFFTGLDHLFTVSYKMDHQRYFFILIPCNIYFTLRVRK